MKPPRAAPVKWGNTPVKTKGRLSWEGGVSAHDAPFSEVNLAGASWAFAQEDEDDPLSEFVRNLDPEKVMVDILGSLSMNDQMCITTAASVGWTVVITGPESAAVESPDGKHRHHFTHRRPKRDREIRPLVRHLIEHGDPARVAAIEDSVHGTKKIKTDLGGMNIRIAWPGDDHAMLEPLHCGKTANHQEHRWESWAPYPQEARLDPWSEKAYRGIVWCSGKKDKCPTYEPETPMEIYTKDTYDPSLLGSMGKDSKTLIDLAMEHGWTLMINNKGARVESPDGTKRHAFPFGRQTLGYSIKQVRNSILSHSPAEKPAEKPKPTPAAMPKKAVAVMPPKPAERAVVSENPWMAHHSTGSKHKPAQAYPTRNTIERQWSDGTIDYRCAYPKCDFENDNPRSVVSHFGKKHVQHGELDKQSPPTNLVDDPNFEGSGITRRIGPRKDRIDALARFLASQDNYENMSPDEIAEAALTWVLENSNRGTVLAVEREPMTPEQLIMRIKTLVNDGTSYEAAAKAEESETLIAMLEEENASLQATLNEERAARADMESNLTALRDMMSAIVPKTEG